MLDISRSLSGSWLSCEQSKFAENQLRWATPARGLELVDIVIDDDEQHEHDHEH